MDRLPVISPTPQEVVLNQPWNETPRREESYIPPGCTPHDRPFGDRGDGDEMFALQESYVRGSLRCVRVA